MPPPGTEERCYRHNSERIYSGEVFFDNSTSEDHLGGSSTAETRASASLVVNCKRGREKSFVLNMGLKE